jgi:RHS repeat-associated protein
VISIPTFPKYSPNRVGIRNSTDYSPFGVELDGRTVSGGYRYGFNGEESVDEVSGQKHSYDYGNRFYDPRIGKFLSIDAYQAKYPYISPYSFAVNNPIMGKDVGGDSVILLIWATNFKTNSYGHAAIAVQNYKNVDYTFEVHGQKYTFTTRVPDGTYTFYDLWPAETVGADKESTQTPVKASYHKWKATSTGKTLTKDELMKFTVNGSEKTGPDGVIIFATSKEMDGLIKSKIGQYKENHPQYVGASNNCSDFVLSSLKVLGKNKLSGTFGKESFMTSTFTTPNELFKDSKSYVNSGILDGKVLKDNNNFKQPFITNSQSGGWGTSTPSEPIQKSVGPMGVQ